MIERSNRHLSRRDFVKSVVSLWGSQRNVIGDRIFQFTQNIDSLEANETETQISASDYANIAINCHKILENLPVYQITDKSEQGFRDELEVWFEVLKPGFDAVFGSQILDDLSLQDDVEIIRGKSWGGSANGCQKSIVLGVDGRTGDDPQDDESLVSIVIPFDSKTEEFEGDHNFVSVWSHELAHLVQEKYCTDEEIEAIFERFNLDPFSKEVAAQLIHLEVMSQGYFLLPDHDPRKQMLEYVLIATIQEMALRAVLVASYNQGTNWTDLELDAEYPEEVINRLQFFDKEAINDLVLNRNYYFRPIEKLIQARMTGVRTWYDMHSANDQLVTTSILEFMNKKKVFSE